ncbi:MAG: hypothetical protein M3O15_03395 [Acidobacteriota bacterium]|nr:hypothetical protein [Acidobacteriota bacterium]
MSEKRMREWLASKVILPFIFLVLMWPVHSVLLKVSVWEAFHHAFSHCELLIFSALVFIEIAIEVGYMGRDVKEGIGWWQDLARIFAFVSVFLYGIIVADVIQSAEQNRKLIDPDHRKLTAYAAFACSFALFAVSASIFAFWRVKQIELASKARRAREPKRRRS